MYQNPYIKLKPRDKKPYTEIYLIRHCNPNYKLERAYGEKNMPLSLLGIKQRHYLTKYLLSLNINKVYVSEITRAQETAKTFLKKTKKRYFVNKDLNELNWADWYKIPYFHMTKKVRENKLANYRKLDRELNKMQNTSRLVLRKIYETNKGKRIAVFSHGNFIKSLLTGILNADVIGFLSLEISQASVSKIIIDKNSYVKISFINDVNYLPTKLLKDKYINLVEEND